MKYTHLKKLKGVFESLGYECHVFAERMVPHPQQHKVVYQAGDTIVCPNCGMDMKAQTRVIVGTEVLYWVCTQEVCRYSFPAE